ncbi:helix-turn-helix domain-containing protein [Bacillus thuringiensis]|uniref:helix-turn-helix domain-containing protein n=1 Tax=Bacillus thuringiensis TaxID=1428 RepID=UPI003457B170
MNKAFKFQIYTNKKQDILIAKYIACNLFVFNYLFLYINPIKVDDTIWLKEINSNALRSALKNLKD